MQIHNIYIYIFKAFANFITCGNMVVHWRYINSVSYRTVLQWLNWTGSVYIAKNVLDQLQIKLDLFLSSYDDSWSFMPRRGCFAVHRVKLKERGDRQRPCSLLWRSLVSVRQQVRVRGRNLSAECDTEVEEGAGLSPSSANLYYYN